MNREYNVLWTEIATKDLHGIITYIKKESQQNAKNVLIQLKESAAELNFSPERGRVVPEFHELGILQYRELIVSRWRVIYKIVEKKVYILVVIDSRQNVEDVLFRRLVGK